MSHFIGGARINLGGQYSFRYSSCAKNGLTINIRTKWTHSDTGIGVVDGRVRATARKTTTDIRHIPHVPMELGRSVACLRPVGLAERAACHTQTVAGSKRPTAPRRRRTDESKTSPHEVLTTPKRSDDA